MTQDEKAAINKQNAQHSTGPKTEEGKAKSSKNATTHGLTSSIPPLQNPHFQSILEGFQADYKPQNRTENLLVLELAHIAWKLEQMPDLEFEIEQKSGLTLADHFMQDKPTPITRLWNLQLRLSGRFDSIHNKLVALQNEPLGAPSSSSGPLTLPPLPPQNPILQNEPTLEPPSSSAGPVPSSPSSPNKPKLQNEPTSNPDFDPVAKAMVRQLLSFATREVQLPL